MTGRTVSDYFDSYASDFNAIYGDKNSFSHNLINRFLRKSMRIRYLKTLAGCQPIAGRTVLDVGCGPGQYGITLAENGAAHACGIDFAAGMIDLARQNARHHGVEAKCDFILDDFVTHRFETLFDYVIVMGFMDYIADPRAIIDRVLSLTKTRAFFSFPATGGILAWQRKRRYRKRCDLFLYREEQIAALFRGFSGIRADIARISRDYFVTVHVAPRPGESSE